MTTCDHFYINTTGQQQYITYIVYRKLHKLKKWIEICGARPGARPGASLRIRGARPRVRMSELLFFVRNAGVPPLKSLVVLGALALDALVLGVLLLLTVALVLRRAIATKTEFSTMTATRRHLIYPKISFAANEVVLMTSSSTEKNSTERLESK